MKPIKKSYLGIALILITYFAASNAFTHEGTGVGSGNNGSLSQIEHSTVQNLKETYQAQTNSIDAIREWCKSVSQELKNARNIAAKHFKKGHFNEGIDYLTQKLRAVGQSFDLYQNESPVIRKMIERALNYVNAIDALPPSDQPDLDEVSFAYFLDGYIDLIINTEENLDRPYTIPFYRHRRCNGCENDGFDFNQFRRKYIEAAISELNFVQEKFTELSLINGDWIYVPEGRLEIFLNLAELSTGFIANDLSKTLDRYRFACAIGDLQTLSENLTAYNHMGDRSIYTGPIDAVNSVAIEMSRITTSLRLSTCYSEGLREREVLSYRTTLNYNNPELVINLGHRQKIEGIRIQAEAFRRDARIEVYVNGRKKSDPYVPARDPVYYVDVNDVTDSIVIRYRHGGDVRISSVKVLQ